MSITRIIGGTLKKTAADNIDIRATEGNVDFIAAQIIIGTEMKMAFFITIMSLCILLIL